MKFQWKVEYSPMTTFDQWLEAELKQRGWKPADLTFRANLGAGTLSNILNGLRNPGPEVCVAIAGAFDYPPEKVFRMAGLLPPAPDPAEDEEELVYLFRRLTAERRNLALQTLRAWLGED
jgi:transcriptional regulator with XRE-family HTH domain